MSVLSVPMGMGVLMFFTTVVRHSYDSTLQADYSSECLAHTKIADVLWR